MDFIIKDDINSSGGALFSTSPGATKFNAIFFIKFASLPVEYLNKFEKDGSLQGMKVSHRKRISQARKKVRSSTTLS